MTAGLARVATHLVEAMADGDLVYVAADERTARAIAAAAQAMTGDPVIHVPASDALPGEDAPASPANAGHRVAALRRLHALAAQAKRPPLACILSAEAIARRYPAPEAFAPAPPRLAVGDTIDVPALSDHLLDQGYFTDDRIDEPGEMAVRGEVIDIFPADAELPVRVEIDSARITSLRSFDPITQRTVADFDAVEIGRAAEPPVGAGVPLLAHLGPATIVLADGTEERRARFLALAADAAKSSRRPSAAVSDPEWREALNGWTTADWSQDDSEAVPRFVERKAPWSAFVRVARITLADGGRLVVAGGPRDLRFIRPRLAKALGAEPQAVAGWAEALALPAGATAVLTVALPEGI